MGVVNVEQERIEEGADTDGVAKKIKILEAINVDYIDEFEVLMPADQCYHINKDDFKVPFACGAKDLDRKLYNELFSYARKIQAPCGLLLKTIELKGLPVVNFSGGGWQRNY
ncbi:18433_t:CDS:2 [Entrophospora sp. SA101]|nr:1442_t:CDS:2 [Entrophospora sp. SA101]CAJ0645910.1 10576_t:CDS:2 [Entrophospora sp. SA101]CAJ0753845.1 13003_t:CDS:2 [Entrophospora sp. SA101]CAJ0760742.1 18433_t:CDS:2 [Entrophospora sp. SA101]CAJ0834898.1 17565_t:CDS:2 [Entrophospora sp. SA101]